MHKILINLHNLKIALICSMEISRDYSSRHGLLGANYIIFRRSTAEIRGGGGESTTTPPPPLTVRWGQKTRLL